MEPNPFEAASRARKASALLVQALREGIGHADATAFDDDEWAMLADRAGVRAPSEVTRALVLGDLERAELPMDTDDPFVGLAS